MGCKIIFSPQAIADLDSAVLFIAKDDPEAALRVGNALIDRVVILENFPLLGSTYRKRPGVRKLVLTLRHLLPPATGTKLCGHSALLARRQGRTEIVAIRSIDHALQGPG